MPLLNFKFQFHSVQEADLTINIWRQNCGSVTNAYYK